MFLQPHKSDLILAMIKWVKTNEDRSHWNTMKNIAVNNNYKNKYGKLKTI